MCLQSKMFPLQRKLCGSMTKKISASPLLSLRPLAQIQKVCPASKAQLAGSRFHPTYQLQTETSCQNTQHRMYYNQRRAEHKAETHRDRQAQESPSDWKPDSNGQRRESTTTRAARSKL